MGKVLCISEDMIERLSRVSPALNGKIRMTLWKDRFRKLGSIFLSADSPLRRSLLEGDGFTQTPGATQRRDDCDI
jgi:hypothetical protein